MADERKGSIIPISSVLIIKVQIFWNLRFFCVERLLTTLGANCWLIVLEMSDKNTYTDSWFNSVECQWDLIPILSSCILNPISRSYNMDLA